MASVRLARDAFDPVIELADFTARHGAAGGVVSFLGQVRAGEGVDALELRQFAPLTLPGMEKLAATAEGRFALEGLLIVHRCGVMAPGDPIVLVAAAARHRRDAFAAADYAMDHLKSDSWFWKRERAHGEWRWVEPREQDHADLSRWD